MKEAPFDLSKITEPLLKWYTENARILPWRQTKDPYAIWISEIMLQQTRVNAVIEYYHRFMSALPDVKALAEASEETVLKLWEGLGYYSRARNLQKAAQVILKEYGGNIPQNPELLRALPGIGEYTAGAIASEAFDLPTPAVDGNVLRIITRLTGDFSDITNGSFKKQVTARLAEIYPPYRCSDFTQSLMELGAVVCVPNGMPDCGRCPLAELCRAKRDDLISQLPVKQPKKQRQIQERSVFLITDGVKIGIRKRPEKGLLASMWELPGAEAFLREREIQTFLKEVGISTLSVEPLCRAKHIFTHIEWHMQGYQVICSSCSDSLIWATPDDLTEKFPLPSAFRPFLKRQHSK